MRIYGIFVISIAILSGHLVQSKDFTQSSDRDNQMSESDRKRLQQRDLFHGVEAKLRDGAQFQQHMFLLEGVQEFILNIHSAEQIALKFFTFNSQNDIFSSNWDINRDAPIVVYIYENNNRILYEGEFYFQHYVLFDSLQESTYTIRMINHGSQKLVSLHIKRITEHNHVESLLKNDQLSEHSQQISRIETQVKYLLNAFKRFAMVHSNNARILIDRGKLYYCWQVVQAVLAVLVGLVQVVVIRKMCRPRDIV